VLFKVDTAGQETVLYSFTGGTTGLNPNAVIRDGAGNFYGTTVDGGVRQKVGGVVFMLKPQ
jgi:hypothetical protein